MKLSQRFSACFKPAPAQRMACALAGVVASVVVCGSVVWLFAQASSAPWLPSNPEAIALAQACQRPAARSARENCMRDAIAHWQAADRRDVQFAAAHQK